MGRASFKKMGALTLLAWLPCVYAHGEPFLTSPTETGTLIVKVQGLPNDQGVVRFGLYADKQSYNKRKGAVRSADLQPHGRKVTWRIEALPFGDYAIMLHHDKNANGRMDKNFIGLPQEGYGFSNDAEPGFGAPYFSQARFDFRDKHKTLVIHLQP